MREANERTTSWIRAVVIMPGKDKIAFKMQKSMAHWRNSKFVIRRTHPAANLFLFYLLRIRP